MKLPKKIVLIGAGNLATVLGQTLLAEGYEILQVYSRTKGAASMLAKKVNAEFTNSLKDLSPEADIYIVCVKDDIIADTTRLLDLNDKLVLHTSGSVDMDVLKGCSKNYGVLYPLQTFSKNKRVNFKKIPICIEGSNPKTKKEVEEIASSLSNNIYPVNSEKRKVLHLAAVFACNFSNHMYAIAENLLKKNHLPFKMLLPVIKETASKIKKISPRKAQTGPAARNDKKIMEQHLELLKDQKNFRKIYKQVSKDILKFTPSQKKG